MNEVIGYFDGSVEPSNPGGIVGYGFHYSLGETDSEGYGIAFSGGTCATNSVAEYIALGALLMGILENRWALANSTLIAKGDNKSTVNCFNGVWRVNTPHLRPVAALVHMLKETLETLGCEVRAEWVSRTFNVRADKLSRRALNDQLKDRLPLTEALGEEYYNGS